MLVEDVVGCCRMRGGDGERCWGVGGRGEGMETDECWVGLTDVRRGMDGGVCGWCG